MSNFFASKMRADDEMRYILSVDPAAPGQNFNHDPACFAEYCAMQARDLERHGWSGHATAIREHAPGDA